MKIKVLCCLCLFVSIIYISHAQEKINLVKLLAITNESEDLQILGNCDTICVFSKSKDRASSNNIYFIETYAKTTKDYKYCGFQRFVDSLSFKKSIQNQKKISPYQEPLYIQGYLQDFQLFNLVKGKEIIQFAGLGNFCVGLVRDTFTFSTYLICYNTKSKKWEENEVKENNDPPYKAELLFFDSKMGCISFVLKLYYIGGYLNGKVCYSYFYKIGDI
jgi:hypothetical protein